MACIPDLPHPKTRAAALGVHPNDLLPEGVFQELCGYVAEAKRVALDSGNPLVMRDLMLLLAFNAGQCSFYLADNPSVSLDAIYLEASQGGAFQLSVEQQSSMPKGSCPKDRYPLHSYPDNEAF